MDRRGFLRRFGIGAAAAVAAPSIVKAALPEPIPPPTGEIAVPESPHMRGKAVDVIRQYPMTPDECYIDNITEYLERERMRQYWPEIVRRYGDKMSITDFIKLSQ